ncbi:MAG: hypothetical protein HY299_18510 [Verrucomicrobia bacterium]|nr:hypothetical protein [Verrucomicrobiota bacterium]
MSGLKALWSHPRLRFFQDSLLMLCASVGGGVFTMLTNIATWHFLQKNALDDYTTLTALRDTLTQFTIPVMGVQTAFAQLAAKHAPEVDPSPVSGALRGQMRWLAVYWLGVAALMLAFQPSIGKTFKVGDPAKLWIGWGYGWLLLLTPAFFGVIQGRQNFKGYAIAKVSGDVGILVAVTLVTGFILPNATGAIGGLGLGALLSFLVVTFLTRRDWSAAPAPFEIWKFLKHFIPLTAGVGVITYMFTADILVVQRYFAEGSAPYAAARTLGKAVIFLVAPVSLAMFPSIARSAARSEETPVLGQALGITTAVGCCAALACTLFPEFLLGILFPNASDMGAAQLVPLFAWRFLPLAIASLLINNLLARERYAVVPWMLLVPLSYSITLHYWHPSRRSVIQTLGWHSLAVLVLLVFFTWRETRPKRA